jgi:hypothetical protein
MPNVETNAVAGVLNGFGGNNPNRGVTNSVNEDLLNDTLAGFPGGAEAFWEGMQGTGIGREEFLQMLASDMHPTHLDPLLTRRDHSSTSIPQTPSASQPTLFPQSSQPATATSTQPTSDLPANLQSQLASITAGLSGNGGGRREYISLNDVLSRDVLNRVLQMPGIGERLRPGMPENWDVDEAGVSEVIQSPQFQQVHHKSRFILINRPYPRFRMHSVLGNSLLFCNNLAWKVALMMWNRFYELLWSRSEESKELEDPQMTQEVMMAIGCKKTRLWGRMSCL